MRTSAVIAHDVCSVMLFCCKEWLFEFPARPVDLFSEFPHTKPMLTGCFLIYLYVVFSNRVNFFSFSTDMRFLLFIHCIFCNSTHYMFAFGNHSAKHVINAKHRYNNPIILYSGSKKSELRGCSANLTAH